MHCLLLPSRSIIWYMDVHLHSFLFLLDTEVNAMYVVH